MRLSQGNSDQFSLANPVLIAVHDGLRQTVALGVDGIWAGNPPEQLCPLASNSPVSERWWGFSAGQRNISRGLELMTRLRF